MSFITNSEISQYLHHVRNTHTNTHSGPLEHSHYTDSHTGKYMYTHAHMYVHILVYDLEQSPAW